MKKEPSQIVSRPRITEKSAFGVEKGVYTFEVSKDSNKESIKQAIKVLYKVSPRKIAIVKLPSKKVFSRGKNGKQSAIKKAYVFLKKGEKIDLA
jgi:large subunit ribosomal protein L23